MSERASIGSISCRFRPRATRRSVGSVRDGQGDTDRYQAGTKRSRQAHQGTRTAIRGHVARPGDRPSADDPGVRVMRLSGLCGGHGSDKLLPRTWWRRRGPPQPSLEVPWAACSAAHRLSALRWCRRRQIHMQGGYRNGWAYR